MKWLIAATLTFTSLFTQASNLTNTCGITGDETLILYSNGMDNEDEDRERSLMELIYSVAGTISDEELSSIDFDFLINQKENRLFELMEVIAQRSISEQIDWNFVWAENGYAPLVPQEVFGVDEVDDPAWDSFVSQGIRPYIDDDFTKQKELYLNTLREGKRIIVVAHSQGNMYANAIYKSIEAEYPELAKSISIINVASPDSASANQGKLVTAQEDAVINFVRKAFPSTPDGNFFFNDIETLDRANHSFLNAYMRDATSATIIQGMLRQALDETPYPQITIDPSNLPEGRLGCDTSAYVWAGAQEVVNGTVTIPFDVDYLRLELEFDTGILSKASAVEITSDGEELVIDKGDFIVENQTIQIDISAIAEGSTTLTITPLVVDENLSLVPIAVNQVSASHVPNGYLPSNSSSSFELVVVREADEHISCDALRTALDASDEVYPFVPYVTSIEKIHSNVEDDIIYYGDFTAKVSYRLVTDYAPCINGAFTHVAFNGYKDVSIETVSETEVLIHYSFEISPSNSTAIYVTSYGSPIVRVIGSMYGFHVALPERSDLTVRFKYTHEDNKP